jgi:hypothetical protein
VKILALIAGMGLLVLLGAVLAHQPAVLELQNRSGEPVEAFAVWVGDEPVAEGQLGVGTLDRHLVPVRHEGPIRLELRFADGRESRLDAGWFSPGQANPTRLALVSRDSLQTSAW